MCGDGYNIIVYNNNQKESSFHRYLKIQNLGPHLSNYSMSP